MELTKEMLDEVKNLGSADEIIGFAEENGAQLSKEDAEKIYSAFHKEGELDDDDLEGINGGAFLDPSSWLGKLVMMIFGRMNGCTTIVAGSTKQTEKKTAKITDAFARGKQKGVDSLGNPGESKKGYITL